MRLLVPVALLLTGCATAATPGSTTGESERPGLSPRNIAPETCALYVWTAGPERVFTYFADADGASLWEDAELDLGPVDAPLSPTQELSFTYGEDTYTWELELRSPESFGGGTRYDAGLLRSSNQGFQRVQPVVGLATCSESRQRS